MGKKKKKKKILAATICQQVVEGIRSSMPSNSAQSLGAARHNAASFMVTTANVHLSVASYSKKNTINLFP